MTRPRTSTLRTMLAAIVAAVVMLVPTFATTVLATGASASSECSPGVPCALSALADLRSAITQNVTDPGLATSLTAKVDAATASVLGGRTGAALLQVNAEENQATSSPLLDLFSDLLKSLSDSAKAQISNIK